MQVALRSRISARRLGWVVALMSASTLSAVTPCSGHESHYQPPVRTVANGPDILSCGGPNQMNPGGPVIMLALATFVSARASFCFGSGALPAGLGNCLCHALVGQRIGSLVTWIAGMALDPQPLHIVPGCSGVKSPP